MSDFPLLAGDSRQDDATDHVVEVCDRLLAVLFDAAHGWRIAAEAIADDDLSAKMLEQAREKEDFAVQLAEIMLHRAGAIPHDHTGRGRLLNWWLELRAALSHGKPETILGICHTGSKALVREYDLALKAIADQQVHDILVSQARRVEQAEEWLAAIA